MNAETEKLCFEEIDHLILDSNKKVTLATIANNWSVPFLDAEIILEKWLKKYSGDRKIAKEYLIRGIDVNGNSIITIVSEKSLPKLAKICSNHSRTLYSAEVSSANGKTLNIQEPSDNKYIGLKIKTHKRNVKVNKIVVPAAEKSIKKEPEPPKKPSNPFEMSSSSSSKVSSNQVKTEKTFGGPSKDVKVKEETKSPQKSPKKNQAAKSAKAAQGKSSIASFFASKPPSTGTSKVDKSISEATTKIESVKIKDEPVVTSTTNSTSTTSKRPHSSDSNEDVKSIEVKQKAQAKKKMKLEPKSARSRLMQICDSSSDEEDASERNNIQIDSDDETKVVKKEKENKTPSPNKSDASKSNGSTDSRKRRAKVKKMVTKTFEDEDGFINTVRELVEVSCSEDEATEIAEPPPKKATKAAPATSTATSTTSKKKISPPAGKKQGSILSFFGKK